MVLANITTVVTVSTAVGGLVLAALSYVEFQRRRDRLAAIRQGFNDVVALIASSEEERRLAGAILLRRFFDKHSEFGIRTLSGRRRAPYAEEARGVIAAALRGQETGNFQKILADGLAYSRDLRGVDLTRANLHDAYLVPKRAGVSLARADFFRADLSDASLRGCSVPGGVFFEARLCRTVFSEAHLEEANFFRADLAGARFDSAYLMGAKFTEARNVPRELHDFIKDGKYISDQPAPARTVQTGGDTKRRVFLSMPSRRNLAQRELVARFKRKLEENGLEPDEIPEAAYLPAGSLSEVRERVRRCCGAAIFGFGQLRVQEAVLPLELRPTVIRDAELPTPWNHLEAGIAFALNLPLLVFSVGTAALNGAIFEAKLSEGEQSIYRVSLENEWSVDPTTDPVVENWISRVLETPVISEPVPRNL